MKQKLRYTNTRGGPPLSPAKLGIIACGFLTLAFALVIVVLAVEHPVSTVVSDQLNILETHPGKQVREHAKPPPFEAHGNQPYQIHQLRNPDYLNWIKQEITPLNHRYEPFVYKMNWEHFTKGGDSLLHPHEVVVVLQCSPERLPFVRRMKAHWGGPMALAIFIPHPALTPKAGVCRQRMMDYVHDMNQGSDQPFALSFLYADADSLTLHCDIDKNSTGLEAAWMDKKGWTEQFYKKDYLTLFDASYPMNHARNIAIDMVQTNAFVFLADADFVPGGRSGKMYSYLKKDTSRALQRLRTKWRTQKEREVLIVPAFERLRTNLNTHPQSPRCFEGSTECWVYEKMDVPYSKHALVEMVHNNEVESFYMTRYQAAYGCYQSDKWLHATEEYEAFMLPECEPYIIGLKHAMPAYDNRFRGNRMDKVSFIRHMDILRTKFTVEPNLFIVHLPHYKSHSLDDVVNWMPAGHDKDAYYLALQSIFIGEKHAEVTLERLLAAGLPQATAEIEANRVGDAQALSERNYFLSNIFRDVDKQRKRWGDVQMRVGQHGSRTRHGAHATHAEAQPRLALA